MWLGHNLFDKQSSVDRHLGCVQFVVLMNKAAMNLVHFLVWLSICYHLSQVGVKGSEISRS